MLIHTHTSLLFIYLSPSLSALAPLSLHDALPISRCAARSAWAGRATASMTRSSPRPASGCSLAGLGELRVIEAVALPAQADRKSTRLNSSHQINSYAAFCLKKKNKEHNKVSDPSI